MFCVFVSLNFVRFFLIIALSQLATTWDAVVLIDEADVSWFRRLCVLFISYAAPLGVSGAKESSRGSLSYIFHELLCLNILEVGAERPRFRCSSGPRVPSRCPFLDYKSYPGL